MAVPPALRTPILQLVADLVRGDFAALDRDGRAGELTAAEIRDAIDDYGRTLVPVPDAGLDEARAYAIPSERETYRVDVPLWTAEEGGRGDLTLSVRGKIDDGDVQLAIENIHVS